MSTLKFYEALKAILQDVETFLNSTLDTVKLNKKVTNEKLAILCKLRQLQDEYPQLKSAPVLPEPRLSSTASFGKTGAKAEQPARAEAAAPEDDDGEIYSDVDHSAIDPGFMSSTLSPNLGAMGSALSPSASFSGTGKSSTASVSGESEVSDTQSMTTPTTMTALEITSESSMTGFLIRKNVGKTDLKSMMQGLKSVVLGKMYCVAHGGVLYLYDKLSSKKPSDRIPVFGYEARPSTMEQSSKKEFSFELVSPGKKSYGFAATSEEEMNKWIVVLNEESLKETEIKPAAGKSRGSTAATPAEEDVVELYEDTDAIAPVLAPHRQAHPRSQKPLPPSPDDDDSDGEIYADIEPTQSPPPLPQPPLLQASTVPDIMDDYYDDASGTDRAMQPNVTNQSRSINQSGVNQSNLTVNQSTGKPINQSGFSQPNHAIDQSIDQSDDDDDDYGNKYYGKWDCRAESGNEISFMCGDMVKVMSREYDRFGWWVGRANGLIGLVPRDYLTPAYQLVN